MTRCTRFLALVFIALFSSQLSAQSAEVTYVDGRGKQRSDKGTVEGHTFKGLMFKRTRNATAKAITEDELISVVYSRRPDGFDEALDLYKKGAWRDAIPALEVVTQDLKSRYDWARQECLYLAADAAYRRGDYDTYENFAKRLRSEVPETRYLPILELKDAELALALGKFDEAARLFADISTKPYAPSYVARGAFGVVRAQLEADQVDKAQAALATAATKASGPEAPWRKRVMEARIAFASKDLAGAQKQFEDLLNQGAKEYAKDAKGSRMLFLLAAGANGLGDCEFEQGNFAKASLEYSKVFTLLRGQDGLDPQIGWAMWRFALCCSQIANATQDEEQKRVYTRRYDRMKSEVATSYQRTRGGQAARKMLGLSPN
jgi:tetratricopeptide (TPR) repeat protein